jgi:hypothetical protein
MAKKTSPTNTTKTIEWPKLSLRLQLALTTVLAATLLLLANLAYWVNNSFFNTNNFTNIATTSITSESSRQALATEITDRALADRPVIRNVAGDTAVKLVSGLLGTTQANKLLSTAMSKLQVYLTSSNQQSIVLDLSGIKNVLGKVVDLAGNNDQITGERLANVPDKLVLLNANNVPDLYPYALATLWIGPVAAILALGLLAYPYIRRPHRYYQIAFTQGLVITGVAVISLLWGPLFKPLVLSPLASANIRIVVTNLYESFIGRLTGQTELLITLGLVLTILPMAVHYGFIWYQGRSNKIKRDARVLPISSPPKKSTKPKATR